MEFTAALSLRINISEERDTYLSPKCPPWRGNSSVHSLTPCYGSLTVSHNSCVSPTLVRSLYSWWPMGLETIECWAPPAANPALCCTCMLRVASSLHTHVCNTKSHWPWEVCVLLCETQNGDVEFSFLGEVRKLALLFYAYFIVLSERSRQFKWQYKLTLSYLSRLMCLL